jgi:uncharacterized protein (TIGR03790 family)
VAQRPEQVLIIVNRSSSASSAVASYYMAKRRIPPSNVCLIRTEPAETIQRQVFESDVESPVLECLKRFPGPNRILYIVTTKGVPLRINGSGGRTGSQASVDSELVTLYAKRTGEKVTVEGPLRNPFYRQSQTPFDQRAFPMYLVTRLDAYDVATVKRMIDDGFRAQNRGVFVLDMRNERKESGDQWLSDASILLPEKRVVLDEAAGPASGQVDVIGFASWGSNDRSRKTRFSKMKYLPGSIATQFVSTDARTFRKPPDDWEIGPWETKEKFWEGSPQSLTADLLMEGATAATGHTWEPYLTFAPRPDYFFPAYYSGRNLAESFYLSIPAISWMNVVAGDPLLSLGPP